MKSQLQLNLIENARSFLVEALAKAIAAETQTQEWKFAILHLVQAIELSLKEMLRMQHPILIYKNIENPEHTVTLEQALLRLKRVASFEPSKEESASLKFAANVRNAIVHHEWKAEPGELKLAFARLFGFLSDFHREHLEYPMEDHVPQQLWLDGIKINDYGQELFRRAQERLAKENLDDGQFVIACPRCGWKAMPGVGDNAERCLVCGHIEHLTLCEKCQDVLIFGQHEEIGDKHYCYDCMVYLTDDYWYERARERG